MSGFATYSDMTRSLYMLLHFVVLLVFAGMLANDFLLKKTLRRKLLSLAEMLAMLIWYVDFASVHRFIHLHTITMEELHVELVRSPTMIVPLWVQTIAILIAGYFGLRRYHRGYHQLKTTPREGAIKEGIDNLPEGAVFFDEDGYRALCNLKMYELMKRLSGREIHELVNFEQYLENPDTTIKRLEENKDVYLFPEGDAYHFIKETITDRKGNKYTQYTASEVTEFYQNVALLKKENEELTHLGDHLRQLSADIQEVTREEELLAMKMKVHNELGACMTNSWQLLKGHRSLQSADSLVEEWQQTVRLLRNAEEQKTETDPYTALQTIAAGYGIILCLTGTPLPTNTKMRYILVTVMRVCLDNAARHAEANRMFISLTEAHGFYTLVITNDGRQPTAEITEGGGLTTMRRRLERVGGTMKVTSQPVFSVQVTVPVRKE